MSETEGAPQGASEENGAPVAQAPEQPVQEAQNEPQAPAETKAEEKPPEKKEPPWFMKQIDRQHARLQAQEKELEELRELRRLIDAQQQPQTKEHDAQPNQPSGQARQSPISQAEIDRLVQQRAVELKDQEAFNDACNGTYNAGKRSYDDFDEAVKLVATVSGGAPKREFLEAVTALPNSHDVYYHLGKNPDEAARIFSLPPVRMAVELARLSTGTTPKPKAASRAPAPIAPVGGASRGSDEDSDDLAKMPWDKFCKLREEQEKAYRGRR